MRRYSEDIIKKAKRLREKEKLSFRELGRRLKIPAGTIGTWFKGTVGNRWDGLIIYNEKKRQEFRESEKSIVPNFENITKNQAKLLAGLFYGCEGSKYPAQNGVAFANSEPGLVFAFLKLLRKGFDLNDEKFSVHLQIHSNQDFNELKKFWSNLLLIEEDRFIKPTITAPTGKKHRNYYKGTCTIRYRDYRIQLKLLGIFEEFLRESSIE